MALDARARRRIAEPRAVVLALRVLGALRMALVVAGPARRLGRPAVAAVAALFAASLEAEGVARAAIAVAEALNAAERRIAFASSASTRSAGEARRARAADEPAVFPFAPARDDDDGGEREGNHPVLHDSYGSVPPR